MRRNIITTATIVLAAVLLAPVSSAQVSKKGSGYLFRMKWTQGDSYDYRMTMSTDMGTGQAPSFSMTYNMKVLSVSKGVADITITTTPPGSGKPTTQNIKMDSRGTVGNNALLGSVSTPKLPEGPIKVGGTWTSTTSANQGKMTMNSTYTFKGLKKVDGIECAEIGVESNGSGAFTTKSSGTLYLETKNGQAYMMSMVTDITLGSGTGQKNMKSKVTIQLK